LSGSYQVYSMHADGSHETLIVNQPGDNYQAAWSPDGTRIVYQSNRLGPREPIR